MIENNLKKLIDNNNIEAIQQVLTADNATDLFSYAMGAQKYDIAAFLVQNGANYRVLNVDGLETGDMEDNLDCLYVAVETGNFNLVKAMLDKGAYVDSCTGKYMTTPLMRASQLGHYDMVKLFVEAGADISNEDTFYDSKTALEHAAMNNHYEIVKFLAENCQHDEHRLLNAMFLTENPKIIKFIISQGINIDAQDWDHMNALCNAAQESKSHVCKILIELGADINWNHGKPMRYAAQAKNYVLRVFLDNKPIIEKGDNSPLVFAAKAGNLYNLKTFHHYKHFEPRSVIAAAKHSIECLEYLIDKEQFNYGKATYEAAKIGNETTAFYLAGRYGAFKEAMFGAAYGQQFKLLKKLIENKCCDIREKDKFGNTLLHAAMFRPHFGATEYLFSREHQHSNYLEQKQNCWKRAEDDLIEMTEILLAKGLNINETGNRGQTPLFLAVRGSYEFLIKLFLNNGANVNAKDDNTDTPLHMACKVNNLFLVRPLIEAGAEINAQNNHGYTPLMTAMCHHKNRYDSSAVLLEYDADETLRNMHGKTAKQIHPVKFNSNKKQALMHKDFRKKY